MAVRIEPAEFPDDAQVVRSLFSGYAASLGVDLSFQSFQDELDSLPGKYSESQGGALLVARAHVDQSNRNPKPRSSLTPASSQTSLPTPQAVGCVALRRSSDDCCEMKRLYVVPDARGLRVGDRLVKAIVAKAKDFGYRGIRLDTLPEMRAAQRLYREHGFVEIEPYYDTPVQGTIFMGCDLTSG